MKKKTLWWVFAVCLLFLYLLRIQTVNQENDKTRIHYVDDDKCVRTTNLEISVGEQILYETPACIAEYPDVKEFYETLVEMSVSQASLEAFSQDKYVLLVRVKVKNCSQKLQQIDYGNFHIYAGDSYHVWGVFSWNETAFGDCGCYHGKTGYYYFG